MNANELAEGILAIEERIFLTKKEHQLFQNSATMLRQQQAKLEHLDKMIVWYQDITMTGIKSEEYENGFWDAVGFVKQHQIGVQEK